MKSLFKFYYFRIQNLTQDIAKRHLVKPVAIVLYIISFVTISPTSRYKLLFIAHRFSYFRFIESKIVKEMDKIQSYVHKIMENDTGISDLTNLHRSIVLKKPKMNEHIVVEKGVLLIKFTTTFQYFLKHMDCEQLQEYFHIVLEPSWAGYCLPEILAWTLLKEPIIIECSEILDFEFIKKLNSNLIPVSFGSSDWVDHRLFNYSKKTNPKYDVIYVSNYTSIKRNHVFLNAVAKIKNKDYRAALVCNSWGDNRENVKALHKHFKLDGKLDIYESLTQEELNKLLAESKVNVLLSLKEGSNRSIFEAFFANTPGIVLAENLGVNKAYINEFTGRLISEKDLVKTLLDFYENWEKYDPRKWAMENISTINTKKKLDSVLENLSKKSGQPWSEGTYIKVNKPEAMYFDDRLEYEAAEAATLVTNCLKTQKYFEN